MRPLPLALLTGLLLLGACDSGREPVPVTPNPPQVPKDTLRERTLVPGVVHRYLWDLAGPWAVHVVEVDLKACGVDLRTVKAGGNVVGREKTTQLAAQAAARFSRPVLAAINGDFFTAAGVPIGAQVAQGEPVLGSTNRPVFGITDQEVPYFGADQLTGTLRARSGQTIAMKRVNQRPDPQNVGLYNAFVGLTPGDSGVVEVAVRTLAAPAAVGVATRGVVVEVDTLTPGVGVPAGTVVLAGRGAAATFLRARLAVGDTVTWTLRFPDAPRPVAEMIAGDPLILRGGESTGEHPGFPSRHPRTAIGVKPDGKLLLVTIDGRQSGYSEGMTIAEMVQLFKKLGASEVLNLDGGGSTSMVVQGTLVNRPSDTTGERPVANAVTIVGPAAGSCAAP